jgi:hypothetical protein
MVFNQLFFNRVLTTHEGQNYHTSIEAHDLKVLGKVVFTNKVYNNVDTLTRGFFTDLSNEVVKKKKKR